MTKLVNKLFNAEIVEQLTIWTDGVLNNDRKETSLLEMFWDAKIPATHFISPQPATTKRRKEKGLEISTATEAEWKEMKAMIEDRFSPEVKALIAMEKKTAGNTYIGSMNRDGWSKKANSMLGQIRTAYITRLKTQGYIEAGKMEGKGKNKSPEVKVLEALVDAKNRLNNAETFKSKMDIDVMIKQLEAMIKAVR
jgi:hypothetical protein